jgi:hypothetical protein
MLKRLGSPSAFPINAASAADIPAMTIRCFDAPYLCSFIQILFVILANPSF